MQKFTTYLELADILGRTVHGSERKLYALSLSETKLIFGAVWRNPAFVNIVPQLFGEQQLLSLELRFTFYFR
jgi:hypothetical protein